jgi:hypothetical protein
MNKPESSVDSLPWPWRIVQTKKSRDLSRLFFSAAEAAWDI